MSEGFAPIGIRYTMAPDTSAQDVMAELMCLVDTTENTLGALIETHLDTVPGGWSTLYALRQMKYLAHTLEAMLSVEGAAQATPA
jgi:chorismate synthase